MMFLFHQHNNVLKRLNESNGGCMYFAWHNAKTND
jgi:hypothetical protein